MKNGERVGFGLARSRLTGLRSFFSQASLALKKVPSPSAHSRNPQKSKFSSTPITIKNGLPQGKPFSIGEGGIVLSRSH